MIRTSRILLLLIYGGTGITALAYEILWTRMLSLLFGISIFGVVLTVTAFMAGLGAGSLAGAARSQRISAASALGWLALLESGIAGYALLLPYLMPWLDSGLLRIGGSFNLGTWQSMQGLALMLLLFPAAFAMGYAFPLALRAAGSLGLSLGSMYGINALGGALGAVLPLLLLPAFGWSLALLAVASFGLLLAALAALLARRLSAQASGSLAQAASSQPDINPDKSPHGHSQRPHAADLLAYAGIGAAALILEVVWSRVFGMVLLRTEYVLAVLLLVYLAGIGAGSVLARHMRSDAALTAWLNALPALAAVLAIAGQYALPSVSQWAARTEFASLFQGVVMQGGVVLLLTLPVTLALGAWLPLLARRFSSSRAEGADQSSGGWWYGANSLGAALGALLAGFVLLPLFGAAATLGVGALLLLLCGMRWVSDKRYWLAVPLCLLILWPVSSLPPVAKLLPGLADVKDISCYEDAVALTHVVEQPTGQRLLLSDLQRMDASSEPTAVTVQKNQARLPLLLHPDPRSILFLGLGTGITASGSLPFAGLERTAVELSAGAIRAAGSAFEPVNGGVVGKMRVLRDDARRFLRSDRGSYDVIVGDLFHPDMVGRANLLSVQQFSRARERLAAHGVFVQWLALNQFDVPMLKVVLKSFRSVFAGSGRAMLFVDGYRVALVGFKDGGIDSAALLARWRGMDAQAALEASGGEGMWTWLGRYWGEIPQFAADVAVQDEWAPVIEFALPRVRYAGSIDPSATWRWLLAWREGAEQAASVLRVGADDFIDFKRAWAASGLDVRLWLAELKGDEKQAIEWAQLAHRANALDRWPSFALADRMFDSLDVAAAGENVSRGMGHAGAGPAFGGTNRMSREQALLRILQLRPDHEAALRAMLQLALDSGDAQRIEQWRSRLAAVSPLAFEVRQR